MARFRGPPAKLNWMAPDEPGPNALYSPAREWARRLLIAAALGLAVWLIVVAAGRSETGLERGSQDPVVVTRFPLPEAQAPRQSQVGINLQPGYDGTLFINGVQVPEEQIDGAVDPDEVSEEDLRRFGLRPSNRHRIYFTPGAGKVFESLPLGEATATVNYHKDRVPTEDMGTVSWTFVVQ